MKLPLEIETSEALHDVEGDAVVDEVRPNVSLNLCK